VWAIIAGVLSLLLAYLFDWISLKKTRGSKQVIILFVIGLQIYALLAASWGTSRFSLPSALSILGWALAALSLLLLLYSLFVELPLAETYSKPSAGQQLVTRGTYALVRHSWLLCYVVFLASLTLATRSTVLLYAAPIWVCICLFHVVIQDRLLFPRMFAQYPHYRRETPMLIPNRNSIAACFRTLRARGA